MISAKKCLTCFLVYVFGIGCLVLPIRVCGQSLDIEPRWPVASGWYNWYELKASPHQPSRMMLCGSGWDPIRNALYGFVKVSSDGGSTWSTTFEDRETNWISEQSCAFGDGDLAYFVSEASRVIDGINHHERGKARLFVSWDAGQHWLKTIETAWADYSTSAVSATTGELVTFFNNGGTDDAGRDWGSVVGVLVFSKDGKQINGPFFDPNMKKLEYQGVLPSQATALNDGSVVALYGGLRITPEGPKYDLGVDRLEIDNTHSAAYSVIDSTSPRCFAVDGHALVYDRKSSELLVGYMVETPKGCQLSLARSRDGGKTWSKSSLTNGPVASGRSFEHLSMVQANNASIGLLWEESGGWYFSTMSDIAHAEPPLQLVSNPKNTTVTNDSLMTIVYQPGGPGQSSAGSELAAILNVRSMQGVVMRASGLAASDDHFEAIVPVLTDGREGLQSIYISGFAGRKLTPRVATHEADRRDVTGQIVLLAGRRQSFDMATGILSVDLRLANRGDRPLNLPIQIEARELNSRAGAVTVLNADNRVKGPGAVWDISQSVTGSQLLPGTSTYNSFRLCFHLDLGKQSAPTDNFLNVKLRVLAASSSTSP